MTTITNQLEAMKRNELDVAHFRSADVITNNKGNYIVLHSDGSTIQVIFYQSAEDYVNHTGVILCTKESYSKCLELAQSILE